MNDIITLSKLLLEADSIQRAAERLVRARPKNTDSTSLANLKKRYLVWYQACLEHLPDDLREQLARFYDPGTPAQPMISDFFRETNASTLQAEPSGDETPSPPTISWWHYQDAFKYPLSQQREQVFFARRRLWAEVSALPKGIRIGIANICRRFYQLFTTEDLFIRSGCDSHWYVPPFTPDPKSERMNTALGSSYGNRGNIR